MKFSIVNIQLFNMSINKKSLGFLAILLLVLNFSCKTKKSIKTTEKTIEFTNKALKFDGIDDKIDLFLKPIKNEWTLSAWVKGNDTLWNSEEAIISNGWATIEDWEQSPLIIINGYPSVGKVLKSKKRLDNQWHHLAVVNDGVNYTLFIDGKVEAKGIEGKPICPSFIGSNDNEHFFNGTIDEVRIWNTAIDQQTIRKWMDKPLNKNHKNYSNLIACYGFDDKALDATSLTGFYNGDIKKQYSSTSTNNTPIYVENSNNLFTGSYSPSDFTTIKNSKNSFLNLTTKKNDNILKVLTWNIWHGGIESGEELGRQRVIDIIKKSTADVVLMVETYGAVKLIAEELGFYYYTLGEKDNLAIFSRFPIIEKYPSKFNGFFSLGAKIKMPNNREVIVWDVWLRYALPDYTMEINNPNYTSQEMIEGDLKYAGKDINSIIQKDLSFYASDKSVPVIIGGDFNSCSHLDWTEQTAKEGLHYGKVVDFPVSKIMMNEGFTDSYREIHPDPVKNIGKTWSPLYNYCDDFRIDFIYYKGSNIKPKDSRVLNHHPDNKQMFPSDHAALLTIFEFN